MSFKRNFHQYPYCHPETNKSHVSKRVGKTITHKAVCVIGGYREGGERRKEGQTEVRHERERESLCVCECVCVWERAKGKKQRERQSETDRNG